MEPNRTLSHYRLIEKIGEGGMGVVWKAEDTVLGRTVAVKVLPADLARDEQRRRMFLDEARLASSLSEAHIVQVFEFGHEGDLDFIVMEYVEGKPLSQLLKGKSLTPDRIAEIGRQVAAAVARAHRKGLLHRDLKPSNILITPEGDAKVVDFGLATLFTPSEATVGGDSRAVSELATVRAAPRPEERRIAGTLAYMSPEQARGEDLDARSDIFSLGVVLYEMTTGHRPFTGATSIVVAQRIQEARPRPVHELAPDVPLDLDRSIHKALAPRRGERYQTMDDLVVDLKKLARDLESGSSPSYAATLGGVRRRAAPWWAVVGAVLLLAAAVGASWWLRSSTRNASPAGRAILILPMEVRGQVEGAEFMGRAFAEAIAVDLTRWKDLKVLPVPESRDLGGVGGTLRVEATRNQGAGMLLTGALTRGGGKVEASVNLIDTGENRMRWGVQKSGPEDSLSSLPSSIAQELATHLNLVPKKLYGEWIENFGGPKMSVSPELADALAALRADRWVAYREAAERLVRAFPDDPDAWVHRLVAIANVYAPSEIPARRKELEASLGRLARLDPENPHLELMPAYVGANWDRDYSRAIDAYTRILRRSDLTPHFRSVILSIRAIAEAVIGDSEAAVADLEEAVRLDPSYARTRANGAGILIGLGRFEEAITFARQAAAMNPDPGSQVLLGWCLVHAGRIEESLEPLSKGCDNQRQSSTCTTYGWALSISGRHEEALSVLSHRCGSQPLDCLTYATALVRAGKRSEAEEGLKKAASLPEADAVLDRAVYQAVAGNKAEALRLLRRALDLGAWSPVVFSDRDLKSLREDPEFERILAEARRPVGKK